MPSREPETFRVWHVDEYSNLREETVVAFSPDQAAQQQAEEDYDDWEDSQEFELLVVDGNGLPFLYDIRVSKTIHVDSIETNERWRLKEAMEAVGLWEEGEDNFPLKPDPKQKKLFE